MLCFQCWKNHLDPEKRVLYKAYENNKTSITCSKFNLWVRTWISKVLWACSKLLGIKKWIVWCWIWSPKWWRGCPIMLDAGDDKILLSTTLRSCCLVTRCFYVELCKDMQNPTCPKRVTVSELWTELDSGLVFLNGNRWEIVFRHGGYEFIARTKTCWLSCIKQAPSCSWSISLHFINHQSFKQCLKVKTLLLLKLNDKGFIHYRVTKMATCI